jgi:hypothetical protein
LKIPKGGALISHKSKNRQCTGQNQKDNKTKNGLQNATKKTKQWSFIAFMLFRSVFQSLIEFKTKKSPPLISETTSISHKSKNRQCTGQNQKENKTKNGLQNATKKTKH